MKSITAICVCSCSRLWGCPDNNNGSSSSQTSCVKTCDDEQVACAGGCEDNTCKGSCTTTHDGCKNRCITITTTVMDAGH
ncbi:MAG TPA: hypothetical protein VF331_21510 [Polyangiales bacterium]